MPPIPPGGWTRENLRTYWRERIVNSPQDAPLSHAELAEYLRARNTFLIWLVGIRSEAVQNEPPGPDACFEQRIKVLPSLAAVLVFFLAWLVFANFPSVLGIYPTMILPDDLLCLRNRPHILPWYTYRCDSLIAATDLALVFSLLVSGLVLAIFFRQGGMVLLMDGQRTKKVIQFVHNGYLLFLLIFLLVLIVVTLFILKNHLLVLKVFIPASSSIALLALPSFLAVVLFNLWHLIKAEYVAIFFHITGRFPSWLEDLSP
jgi:hypothetical protein